MKVLAQKRGTFGLDSSDTSLVRTTLYDLIEAMADESEPTDEGLIVAAVLDLTESGKIKWTRPRRATKLLH
ncbi:MAG: hypothetical protein AMK69_02620 [Nitrospira bacterium SG8_3]|nr:MAG: hypothetical protein AMK69_02620 [Nitrospira bacterium SG8_3]